MALTKSTKEKMKPQTGHPTIPKVKLDLQHQLIRKVNQRTKVETFYLDLFPKFLSKIDLETLVWQFPPAKII